MPDAAGPPDRAGGRRGGRDVEAARDMIAGKWTRGTTGGTGSDAAEQYRQAQARKTVRLYERWKAGQK